MITISKALNLVVPIKRDDDTKLYIHSTPIRPETFEAYHLVLAKTFSAFSWHGLDSRSGPSVAAMILKDVAQSTGRGDSNWWDGPTGVGGESGLMTEIVRLSNTIVPTKDKGWTTLPLQAAFEQNLIDAEEKQEVLSLLVFFIVVSAVAPRPDRPKLVKGEALIYELQTTFLNVTEFASSLKTLTPAGTTGASVQAS